MTPLYRQSDLQRIPRETFVARVWFRPELDSTSDTALRLAPDAPELPLLVLAGRQRAGRGRGLNAWWSGEGGLTFSLVVDWSRRAQSSERPTDVKPSPTLVALAAGLAVSDTLERLVPRGQVGLKWPNDVYLGDRKACGILVESRPDAAGRLVVGVGLNVNNRFDRAPTEVRDLGVSMRDVADCTFAMIDVLIPLLNGLQVRLAQLCDDHLDLETTWARHCILTDNTVEITHGVRTTLGRCLGVASDGALLVHTPTGTHRYYSGTVRRANA